MIGHGISDPGPVRRNNEDNFFSDDGLRLYMVADGMGGHSAGEVASSLAVESIVGFVKRSQEDTDLSWPYGIAPELSFAGNCLRTAIHLANRRVFRAAERYDEYTGMGTTVVAALVADGRLSVGHAGDSRAYLFRHDTLQQLTSDDTWAATVLGEHPDGALPAGQSSMRHVLTNVIGVRDHADVHLVECELEDGDVIVLCSDGVHGVVDELTMHRVLAMGMAPPAAAQMLIDTAIAHGTRDNVTALVARYTAPIGHGD